MAVRPNARSLATSQGKGRDLEAAKASAIMEGVEAYHAERVHLDLKLATVNELRFTHSLAQLSRLPRLRVSSFHANLRTLWVEGYELVKGEAIWVPFELVHTDYTLPLPSGSGNFVMSSVGLSSGNHLLEAISHGICEVVEQDAMTLWLASPDSERRSRRLDLGSVDDQDCLQCIERYRAAGVMVGVWEITSDVGLPAYCCWIVDRDTPRFHELYATYGMGCHPSREIALLRALTEAAQSRLTLISGARDDGNRELYERARMSVRIGAVRDELSVSGQRQFQHAESCHEDTFLADVRTEIRRLTTTGIDQIIVVNLTKVEFGIPVVRVIIPGLESVHQVPGLLVGPRAVAAARSRHKC
jgi:ribosomal protein S12 methylthiotransferase accessory factor